MRLGTTKRPIIVRVQDPSRMQQVASVCDEYGWHYICGVEPDKPEDLSDLARMLKYRKLRNAVTGRPSRNAACPCGSGRRYKACCAPPR